jgi:hypothetical protein
VRVDGLAIQIRPECRVSQGAPAGSANITLASSSEFGAAGDALGVASAARARTFWQVTNRAKASERTRTIRLAWVVDRIVIGSAPAQ